MDVNTGSKQDLVTVSEILYSCFTLTTLNYTTKCGMAALVGDFSVVNVTHPLASIHIEANSIGGQDIEILLQHCQQLRRIVLNGCDDSVFEPIDRLAHRLQVLGCNHPFQVPQHDEEMNTYGSEAGIKLLYARSNTGATDFNAVFPLIYNNRKSLRSIFGIIEGPRGTEGSNASYPNFTLDKVSSLGICSAPRIQLILLPSITGKEPIKILSFMNVLNINRLVDSLILLKRTPKAFRLHHTHDSSSTSALTCLFEHYSGCPPLSGALNTVALRYCTRVTDAVLSSLGKVNTLNQLELAGIPESYNGGYLSAYFKYIRLFV